MHMHQEDAHTTEVHGRDVVTSRILVAATDITGRPRQMVPIRDSIRRRREACALHEITLTTLYGEIRKGCVQVADVFHVI
jgi:hypothetical protein